VAHRIERVNSLIRQEISELLKRQVKDPRLDNFIAITEVCTSPDLKYARIFVSHLDGEGKKEETLNALASASCFLRSELFKQLRLRHTPELSFQWDDSLEQGDRLLQLIDEVTTDSISNRRRA